MLHRLLSLTTALILVGLNTNLLAAETVKIPVWYLALDCRGYTQCYAASNGTYTGSFNSARTFTSQREAEDFLNSLTRSLSDKSPRIEQTWRTLPKGSTSATP
jgi:hypothetical protein